MATSSDNLSDEDYHYVLRNNEKKIANLINPTCLVPVLLTKGLLIENELKLLQGIAPDKRGAQLVQILLDKKGGNVLNLFIQALREEEEHIGHRNLAFKLLAELPKPSFHCRAATLPAKPVKRQTAPKRAVSISVSALVCIQLYLRMHSTDRCMLMCPGNLFLFIIVLQERLANC